MSIAEKIISIEGHIGDIYNTLEIGGSDLTNVNKNIVNINSELLKRYKDYLANGTDELWNNWDKTSVMGVNEATINNTIKAKMVIIPKGNTKQAIIPNEYQQVEYIETTGTQRIDTNYKLTTNNLQINTKIYVDDMPSDEQDIVSNQDGTNGRFVLGLYTSRVFLYNKDGDTSYSNAYSDSYSGSQTLEIQANISGTTKKINVNGTDFAITINNYNIYSSTHNITLLSQPVSGLNFTGKIYYCKLYDNNVLVRDYIPCYRKSDSVIGLYDLVNNVFYTNAGTGTFLKGNNIPNPNYPQEIKNVKGKNVFDKSNVVDGEYYESNGSVITDSDYCRNDEYIYCYGQTKITISGASTAGNGNLIFYDKDKNFVDYWGVRNRTLDIPNNVYYIRISTYKNYIDTLQVEFNSVATEYVPGNCVQIKVQNKNLFNNNFDDYIKPVDYRICDIKLEQGKTYKIWSNLVGTAVSGIIVGIVPYGEKYSDFSDVLAYGLCINIAGVASNRTITIDDSWTSPKLVVYATSRAIFESIFENYEVQLEEGSAITSYVPHQEQTVNFPLSSGQELHEIDYLADNDIYNTKMTYIFTGNEGFTFGAGQLITNYFKDLIKYPATNGTVANIKSNKYKAVAKWYSTTENSIAVDTSGNMYINNPNWSSLSDGETGIVGTVIEFELETPTTTPYTTAQKEAWEQIKALYSYNEQTNISQDGNLPFKLDITALVELS